MSRRHPVQPEAFGTLLGYAPGKVPVYSSYYESLDDNEMPDRSQFKSFVDGIFMGYKWQCVEFARRWLYINKGYIFNDIAMAYDIFRLEHVKEIKTSHILPLKSFKNNGKRAPEPGCMLIWDEGGEFEATGHVAIITEVLENSVKIVEQNVEHMRWFNERNWSRELPLERNPDGTFQITCTYEDSQILGWVIQTEDAEDSESFKKLDPSLLEIKTHTTSVKPGAWLDTKLPAQAAFVKHMCGQRLSSRDKDLGRYYTITKEARKELHHATNQLHDMFLKATDYVLQNENLLDRFNLPKQLLPRIKKSWLNRKTHNIMGRFDFSMSERGLKVYEYNSDSAGCFFECGLVQGLWAQHHGVYQGRDAGADFFDALISAWEHSKIDGLLHILKDDDSEEDYMAEYIKYSLDEARIKSKIITGFTGMKWNDRNFVVDKDGDEIHWVWKSWAWETAIDQLRQELQEDQDFLTKTGTNKKSDTPRLVDILLHPEVMVFEPLWSLITSNKALLPVLWQLYPNHPYLLESHFDLNDSLKAKGYVSKPIVGRCGNNISIIDKNTKLLESTEGQFLDRDQIYQEFFPLAKIDDYYVQISTFAVDGIDRGACIRASESMILDGNSDLFALRQQV